VVCFLFLYWSASLLLGWLLTCRDPLGSSNGRGPRCAGWFADYLVDQGVKEDEVRSVVLEGGIKGWVKGGEEYVAFMDGFDPKAW
jgi:arsenical-resistance protein 2